MGAVAAQAQQAVQLGSAVVFSSSRRPCPPCRPQPRAFFLKGCAWVPRMVPPTVRMPGKLVGGHLAVVAVDQAVIAVHNANDLNFIAHPVIQRLSHAAQGSVQAGAVAAGSQMPTRIAIVKTSQCCIYTTIINVRLLQLYVKKKFLLDAVMKTRFFKKITKKSKKACIWKALCYNNIRRRETRRQTEYGSFPEWPMGTDCKVCCLMLRWFESTSSPAKESWQVYCRDFFLWFWYCKMQPRQLHFYSAAPQGFIPCALAICGGSEGIIALS